MVVLAFGDDAWFIAHPGFSPNPADIDYLPAPSYPLALYDTQAKYDAPSKPNPEYFMSYEFATFLYTWDLGDFGPSEFHTRNYRIAQRKSCYPEPLMNGFGVFTKAGERVLQKALAYRKRIIRQYEIEQTSLARWDQCDKMDRIVLASPMLYRNMVYLKKLYNVTFPPPSVPKQFEAQMPDEMEFEFRSYKPPIFPNPSNAMPETRVYLMTGGMRPFPHRRKDFELLVKLGLVGLDQLPKPPETRGRGRAPIGAFLTDSGKRFFEDFQANYDPQVKKANERNQMMYTD